MGVFPEEKKSLLQRFNEWREKKISLKQFVLILSFVVGILTALAACLLKHLIEWIKEFLTEAVNCYHRFICPDSCKNSACTSE